MNIYTHHVLERTNPQIPDNTMSIYPITLGFGHVINNRSELDAFIEEEAHCSYYDSGASMEMDVSYEDYAEDFRRDMLKQYGIDEDPDPDPEPNSNCPEEIDEDHVACSADIYCEGDGCCEKPYLSCGCHPLHRNCTLCLTDEELTKRLEEVFHPEDVLQTQPDGKEGGAWVWDGRLHPMTDDDVANDLPF